MALNSSMCFLDRILFPQLESKLHEAEAALTFAAALPPPVQQEVRQVPV